MPRVRRNRSAVAEAIHPASVRCVIYTRKSTDEGLGRDFNSLDNQRERAEAYVDSQADQGWYVLPECYNDGGFSGGTTDRPALRRVLEDAEAGRFDAVVVYRLDRLSRSLGDFLAVHEFLEQHGIALVSVTESINTTTPHGRMMVNVLLSFAQYERVLGAERTRHKIESARRRGKWTGGFVPLGYDTAIEGGRLVVNKDEAELVRAIFELYADTASLVRVAQELNRRGWRQKEWVAKTGRRCGGGQWNRISLRRLLMDPLNIGRQRLGAETFPGEHKAIVPQALFEKAQRLMGENRTTGGASARNGQAFPLRGLFRCTSCDAAMVPTWSRPRGRLYRYYTCSKAQKRGHDTCPTKSIPAAKVERFIVDQIKRIAANLELQEETFRQAVAQVKALRRGLKAEKKRLERGLVTARADVERLVRALSRSNGPAADAIASELNKAQEHWAKLETRQQEIPDELATFDAQAIDRDDLARALEAFDPIWDALLMPERERMLKLLIERIDYDASTQELAIAWRLSGFGELASELGESS